MIINCRHGHQTYTFIDTFLEEATHATLIKVLISSWIAQPVHGTVWIEEQFHTFLTFPMEVLDMVDMVMDMDKFELYQYLHMI